MSPDVVSVPQTATVGQALERVRSRREVGEEASSAVFLTDADGRLSGWLHIVTLLRADPATKLEEVADRELQRVRPDADLPELANLMSDYNLVALPVVDEDDRVVGVVTVDDLLEDIIPTQWRWRHKVSHGD